MFERAFFCSRSPLLFVPLLIDTYLHTNRVVSCVHVFVVAVVVVAIDKLQSRVCLPRAWY